MRHPEHPRGETGNAQTLQRLSVKNLAPVLETSRANPAAPPRPLASCKVRTRTHRTATLTPHRSNRPTTSACLLLASLVHLTALAAACHPEPDNSDHDTLSPLPDATPDATPDASDLTTQPDASDTSDRDAPTDLPELADLTPDASDTTDSSADLTPDSAGDLHLDGDVEPSTSCAPPPDSLSAVEATRYGRWDVVEVFPGQDFGLLPRKVEVFLPEGYDEAANASRRYPVLYMHDGQNLFDPAQAAFGVEWSVDETLDALVAQGTVEPWIVVALHSTPERIADYTPDTDPMYGGGAGDAYLDLVVEHVKPWVEHRYRVRCGREHTAMAGSSLGGLISLHAALEHGEHFGRVAALSPSLWWNERSMVERMHAQPFTLPVRLWLDAGSGEGTRLATGESTVVANAREVRDRALALGGVYGREVGSLEVVGAQHNESAWAARLPYVLEFLLGDEDFSARTADRARLHVYDTWLAPGESTQTRLDVELGTMRLTWPAALATLEPAGSAVTPQPDGTLRGDALGTTLVHATVAGATTDEPAFVEVDSDMSNATLRFEVAVPSGTSGVYLAGSATALGTWNPAGTLLSPLGGERFAVEVELPLGPVEYKYTQGSWSNVENDEHGQDVPNRHWTVTGPARTSDVVVRWAE